MVSESFRQANKNSRFHVVPDGEQAPRLVRQAGEYAGAARPGLILLDLNLPGTHGLEVLTELKSDHDLKTIPVVVLSGSRHPADIERSYALHANAYIVKLADFEGFFDVIEQIDACFLSLIHPPPAGQPHDHLDRPVVDT